MMRGCVCRWCGEAVTEADERYEAMDALVTPVSRISASNLL